jgi:hypothetical protein
MYIYYEIVFEKRERDGEGRLGELERVGAGLHHYTLHEGRMGFACFPPCVRDWFSVLSPDCKKMAKDRRSKAEGYHSRAGSYVGWAGCVMMACNTAGIWIAVVILNGIIVPPGHVWDGWDMW